MTTRMKGSLLGGLVLLWVAVLAWRVIAAPEPQRVPLTYVSGQHVVREDAQGDTDVPLAVRPTRTAVAAGTFTAPKNIFAPLDLHTEAEIAAATHVRLLATRKKAEQAAAAAVPAPPAPPPPTSDEVAAQEVQRQLELTRQQREQAIQQARKTMGQYRFLGYLTRNGAPQAFLRKGNDIYIVKTGETVEGKIQVTTIDATTVKLTEQTTSTETALPLVKEGS